PVIALTHARISEQDASLPKNILVTSTGTASIQRGWQAALHSMNGDLSLSLLMASAQAGPWGEEVQTLFDLSRSLTEVLDLSEVLNRVVEAARRLTNAEEGMILLPDDELGELYLRAKVGIDVEVARNFRVKTQDTLAGRVFSTGKPVLIGAQGPQKVKTEYLVNALLYVPIIYEGTCTGVLGVNNKNSDLTFSLSHQQLLENLASFAAIAIENARIHEETLQRTRELQTLVEASQILNSSLSLDKTLPNICEQLMGVVNVNLSEIYEWDRERNQLRTLARSFRTIWPAGYGPTLEISARPALEQAFAKGRIVVISRRDETAPASEVQLIERAGADTMIAVPILGGDQPLGVLQLFYMQPVTKRPETEVMQRAHHMMLEVLVAFSGQASPARAQSIFRSMEDILRLADADWCEVAILRPDKQSLALSIAVGQGVWLAPPQPYLDMTQYPDIAEAIETQSPIAKQIDSKIMTAGIRALIDSSSSRSVLALPLIQRGQTQGMVLFGDARRSRVFTQRDIDMGRAIVGQAATALENARLVHDLERSLLDLRDAQDRLVQTARLSAMGELAAAVAHQINNPLTTIMVDSEMLLLDEKPDSRNYRSLQAINRAGKRSAGVARRLLAIARPNDPEAPPERIDVKDTIDGVLSLVKAHIERDGIQIITQIPEEALPPVSAVPGRLDDIWLNLLMNAHDALMGRAGAKIGINVTHQAGSDVINVAVWDNGPGIPAKLIDEIFKPFFTTKPVGEGTGLGLHICRQTVERIGGRITVKSSPGEGTEFLVLLPVRQGGVRL
ncbi:MAG: GAF domain-containing protein, partial [Anaerolineae bacterium]|nr:GAF domain-containing protein [Anaerolineae bacterium]